jgi:hypothetical protein
MDPLQTNFRAYPIILANNRSTKLGTLICSAHARTVRPQARTVRTVRPQGRTVGALKLVLNTPYSDARSSVDKAEVTAVTSPLHWLT